VNGDALVKNRLKEFRTRHKLSFGQIARQLGVSRSYVCKLEKGKQDPSARVMLRLAKVIRCPVEVLFLDE
jgi:putative transcriptional regulator